MVEGESLQGVDTKLVLELNELLVEVNTSITATNGGGDSRGEQPKGNESNPRVGFEVVQVEEEEKGAVDEESSRSCGKGGLLMMAIQLSLQTHHLIRRSCLLNGWIE